MLIYLYVWKLFIITYNFQHFDETKIEGWKCVNLNIKMAKENFNAILYGLVEPLWFKNVSNASM